MLYRQIKNKEKRGSPWLKQLCVKTTMTHVKDKPCYLLRAGGRTAQAGCSQDSAQRHYSLDPQGVDFTRPAEVLTRSRAV